MRLEGFCCRLETFAAMETSFARRADSTSPSHAAEWRDRDTRLLQQHKLMGTLQPLLLSVECLEGSQKGF
jgi:hypothetical protein